MTQPSVTNKRRHRARDDRQFATDIYLYNKFQPDRGECDIDREVFTREFSGRLTRERYKRIDRFCRAASRPLKYRCGHDYDCCGCVFAMSMSFTYKQNLVVIRVIYYRNY